MSRAVAAAEEQVVRRILDALWREDYRGLRSRSRPAPPDAAGGHWRRTDLASLPARTVLVPVGGPGVFSEHVVRRGCLQVPAVTGARTVRGLDPVLELLAPDPAADDDLARGFADFTSECRQALAAELAVRRSDRAGDFAPGLSGALDHEARAARVGHPLYPTGHARRGLRAADLPRYAPEHRPTFTLRWVSLPADRVRRVGGVPACWPDPDALGLPAPTGADPDRVLVPVHPLTWSGGLDKALAELGALTCAVRAPRSAVAVRPTLSMRTVAVLEDPTVHLKLPLPTATLGALNRRTLRPGDLTDARAGARLVTTLAALEPGYRGRILHAEEHRHGYAGHQLLGYLVRRLPAGLDRAHVVPVAALAAPGPDGEPVLATLAERLRGGDTLGLFADYLTLLLGWHVTLWLRYGVALEAHQQNVCLVLNPDRPGAAGLRLLYRDDDSPRVDPAALRGALGAAADPLLAGFADPRVTAAGPVDLADVFTTITVHLCAAAPAAALAAAGIAPWRALLGLIRDRLAGAVAPHAGSRDAAVLTDRVLRADRLPGKAMVTAGTLLPKSRTGASDINKHYRRDVPNYLREDG